MNSLTNKLLAVEYKISGPGLQTTGDIDSVFQFEKIISTIIGFFTIIGVIFFVVQVILAGFTLISSKGDPKQFQAAQAKLIHNLIGLLIVVVAFGVTAFLTSLLGITDIFDLQNSIKTVNTIN
jgi:large-conductance mechanosensitive channel